MKKSAVAVIAGLIGAGTGTAAAYALLSQKKPEVKSDKFKIYYNTLNQWIKVKNQGKNLGEYLIENNYKRIAIYGMGELGNRLCEELKQSDVEIVYGIDQSAQFAYSDLTVYSLEDELPEVDAVVVTAVFAFDEIRESIEGKVNGEIISLEDIVFEV